MWSACNIFIAETSGAFTLSNYGRERNCSFAGIFPGYINVMHMAVGRETNEARLKVSINPIERHFTWKAKNWPFSCLYTFNVLNVIKPCLSEIYYPMVRVLCVDFFLLSFSGFSKTWTRKQICGEIKHAWTEVLVWRNLQINLTSLSL